MRSRTVVTALALLVLAVFGLAACGGDDNDNNNSSGSSTATTSANGGDTGNVIKNDPANAQTPTLVVGSKNFTEEFILGQIYSQALKAAGFKVKNQFNLGSEQIALKAVKSNDVGMYPEYTGTVLTSFCKVPTDKVPTDPDQAYTQAKACMAKQNVVAEPRTPYTNSNGFAVTQDTAQKLGGVTKLSDLKGKSDKLTISGPPECQQRTDCLLGLEKVYGLKFKKFLSIDLAKRHEVLKSGQTDVGEVFTTDGQIKAENFVLLQDDKQLFPPYNATLLVRKNVADAAGPNFAKTIELVQKGLTTEVMQELNSRVDLDKESPAAVAKEYLQEAGYLQ